MALLVPLLAPLAAQITAGVAVGLANASQAETTAFSFQIGKRVFSTRKPFPFQQLPFELREEIILIALELSKEFLPPPPSYLPPGHPWLDPSSPMYNHPLNSHHPLYVGSSGERELNGFPTSTWRWTTVSREWWAVIRVCLWRDLALRGPWAYKGFLRILDDFDSSAIKHFVNTVTLKEGFEGGEIYQIMRALPNAEGLTVQPNPREQYIKPFGINLIPANPGPSTLTITLPFDRITNTTTRAHLLALPRLHTLNLHLQSFAHPIDAFLASLPHLRTLKVYAPRVTLASLQAFSASYTASHPAAAGGADSDDARLGLGLARVELLVLSVPATEVDAMRAVLGTDALLRGVCTVYAGVGADRQLIYAPEEAEAVAAALAAGAPEGPAAEDEQGTRGQHWERTTNMRLFGGFLGLRMESRK